MTRPWELAAGCDAASAFSPRPAPISRSDIFRYSQAEADPFFCRFVAFIVSKPRKGDRIRDSDEKDDRSCPCCELGLFCFCRRERSERRARQPGHRRSACGCGARRRCRQSFLAPWLPWGMARGLASGIQVAAWLWLGSACGVWGCRRSYGGGLLLRTSAILLRPGTLLLWPIPVRPALVTPR